MGRETGRWESGEGVSERFRVRLLFDQLHGAVQQHTLGEADRQRVAVPDTVSAVCCVVQCSVGREEARPA